MVSFQGLSNAIASNDTNAESRHHCHHTIVNPHHMVQQYFHYNDLQSSWLEMKVAPSLDQNAKNHPYLISKVFQI